MPSDTTVSNLRDYPRARSPPDKDASTADSNLPHRNPRGCAELRQGADRATHLEPASLRAFAPPDLSKVIQTL